ncbi:hypothetical protein C0J52_15495, partial [Blattella germanica]
VSCKHQQGWLEAKFNEQGAGLPRDKQRRDGDILPNGSLTILKETDHTHTPNWDKCKAAEVVARVKENVQTSNSKKENFISTNYEITEMNAITEIFSSTKLAGCLFHFAQSMWRRVQASDLVETLCVERNKNLHGQFHSIISLAFLTYKERDGGQDIEEIFDRLKEESVDALQPIFDYVETIYLRGWQKERDYIQSMSPIHVWNCHGRVIAWLPRKTNPVEGWHNQLNFIMGMIHPSFNEFLEKLQNEVAEANRQILRLDTGGSPNVKFAVRCGLKVQVQQNDNVQNGYTGNV